MNSNIVDTLMYTGMPIVVAIISAIIMRVKWERFNSGELLLCILFGVLWPITIVGWIVHLTSDFLFRKINAKKGN